MIAIVDCNSFYCSCERVFRPSLWNKPVVVLSNNDGCIIARTDEAKALGVEMAGPYFKVKQIIEANGVVTFSSNYNLYGDMSRRVMDTIRAIVGNESVEVYSVDECFIEMGNVSQSNLSSLAVMIRDTVEEWTGIKVSVGIAPTKVLSKIANRLAKKQKALTGCIKILQTKEEITEALKQTNVGDVWGIGGSYCHKLRQQEISTAFDLSLKSTLWARKHLGGVVGERLVMELNGIKAKTLEHPLIEKNMIATTRMFGKDITDLPSIKEALSTYAARASEKLRRQKGAAKRISVFVIVKEPHQQGHSFRHGKSLYADVVLPNPTAFTNDFVSAACNLAERLFVSGKIYKKAGVILSEIIPDSSIQCNLFAATPAPKLARLMKAVDNVNFSMRDDILKFASQGTNRNWKMQQQFQSGRYTTRWNELHIVN